MKSNDTLDEGPETGDESDEDIIRNYLPGDNHDIIRNYEPHHNIPAINITLHSANTNHVLGRWQASSFSVKISQLRSVKFYFVPSNDDIIRKLNFTVKELPISF